MYRSSCLQEALNVLLFQVVHQFQMPIIKLFANHIPELWFLRRYQHIPWLCMHFLLSVYQFLMSLGVSQPSVYLIHCQLLKSVNAKQLLDGSFHLYRALLHICQTRHDWLLPLSCRSRPISLYFTYLFRCTKIGEFQFLFLNQLESLALLSCVIQNHLPW